MVWIRVGKGFLAFFEAYHHTVVVFTDATVAEFLTDKGTVAGDDNLTKTHLPLLHIGIIGNDSLVHCCKKGRQLFIATNGLNPITGKEDRITARNVNTLTAAKNAAHMNAKLIGKLELAQRKARPSGIFRHFHIGKMDVSIEQVSFIEGTLVSVYLCLDIA